MPTPSPSRLLLFLLPALCFGVASAVCYPHTADDAFITFRYARHLADGNGLVFNAGERVEGFSNLLWVLLLTPFEMLGLGSLQPAKLLGNLCGVATLLVTGRIARRHLDIPSGIMATGMLLVGLSVGFVYYAGSGLETLPYTFLILAMNSLLLDGRPLLASLVAGVLCLTRPEGFLFVPVPAAAALAERARMRHVAIRLATPLLFFTALLAWRFWYYGEVFPNTFRAKIGGHNDLFAFVASRFVTFVTYTYVSLAANTVLLFLALVGIALAPRRRLAPLCLSLGLVLFFIWFSGGDWMHFGRFYVPALPLLGLFALQAMQACTESLWRSGRAVRLAPLVLCIPVAMASLETARAMRDLVENRGVNPAMHSRAHRAVARHLLSISEQSDLVAADEIGALGYDSGLPILDLIGLTRRSRNQTGFMICW